MKLIERLATREEQLLAMTRRASDADLVLGAIITGVARWEWLGGCMDRGELCFGGLRHLCVYRDGRVELTVNARLSLRKTMSEL